MSIQQLLESVAERVSAGASIKNVYGEPVVLNDRIVIPIARFRYAFGGGGGGPKDSGQVSGGGGGGQVSAGPSGALEVTPQGTRFIDFDDRRKMGAALALGFLLGAAVVSLTQTRKLE